MITVLEGAEKAGKTTLANAFVGYWNAKYPKGIPMVYRHWGQIASDSEYSETLQHDALDKTAHYVWDRGWASETVYANLLNRPRRARGNAWLMEMLHGRATPLKYIVVSDPEVMKTLRTADDLPVDPGEEQGEFLWRFPKYKSLFNDMTTASLEVNLKVLESDLLETVKYKTGAYTASPSPIPLAFVASRNKGCRGDKWMPFSFDKALQYLGLFGNLAPSCFYMFAHEGDPTILNDCRDVVVQGSEAKTWVKYYTTVQDSRIHAVDMLRPTAKQHNELIQLMKTFRSRYGRAD